MTTFLQFGQGIADRLDDSRPTTLYNADLSVLSQTIRRYRTHINLAYNFVWNAMNKDNEYREASGTISLVAGTESYNFPSGFLNIDQIQMGSDPPMEILPWSEYEQMKRNYGLIVDSGNPSRCSIWNRKIWFYPTPDATGTVNVRGQQSFTEMNLNADEPDLAADFHPVILELAIYLEMKYEANPAAGELVTKESGGLVGSGGQAALAVALLNNAKRNSKDHATRPARMISHREADSMQSIRRLYF